MQKQTLYLRSEPLITPEECKRIADKVLALKSLWIPRGEDSFYTLGASTYNDDPKTYAELAELTNLMLAREFGGILEKVSDFFELVLASKVIFLPRTALMGFHIFDERSAGLTGHIHVDEPFKRLSWPSKISKPLTITLPVMMPNQAGLNVYPDIDRDWFALYDRGVPVEPPEPHYHPYQLGHVYWHSGLLPHQIANPCAIHAGQHRITLQGHAVRLETGQTVLYF